MTLPSLNAYPHIIRDPRVAIAGSDDKRQITLTLVESQSREILPG